MVDTPTTTTDGRVVLTPSELKMMQAKPRNINLFRRDGRLLVATVCADIRKLNQTYKRGLRCHTIIRHTLKKF
jgi:hypothetical protein